MLSSYQKNVFFNGKEDVFVKKIYAHVKGINLKNS